MAKITFVLGGARSGKSAFAEGLAKKYKEVSYIATAEANDDEMRERIQSHRVRRPLSWKTFESPYHVDTVVSGCNDKAGLILIDCITLYITNMLLRGEPANSTGCSDMRDEVSKQRRELILSEIRKLNRVCHESRSDVIIISNEVGLGIVPDNALSREFRDIAGCANQILAGEADEVYFMVAGIAQRIK
ncbi:bifunctional adenosylcobinamide kinase/adenosylcobinamide-phosphate guanylyltransferase [Candidatus Brocadia sapporoensis]|uniref:Adenosylcobinamide kinase n=1 Tax=Candidatus Brocadia sapporoensis TaxID=392547 RepID=A0A1V6LZZ9_9BACT|nr:bifunctional adenosylcobinamide kinase/adenosylcobinamide-phosphate guanylyltransferase [Candidatus Brocadia sapporoensis]MDG6005742.1 bifunctional adenosylcobinamide kinase/adenosylcobinamide-phosphate guanylyltransferase [Candidatus Brocadia sp.]OQD45695.1 bifunctional adenosylcobinamide kinase/adenosylcobinamide-phosphate guanylyltransferase [Candidatus Brocadia sapporoensis]GJQ24804.1 MAG: adenosylcobinamide kinase/adenosylcobinamide phosphate guanyltransferase [Candidatus Brocadia sappor